MPKREDIKKILIIGAGPIVIGQACEFDYSGTQAVKSLKEEGYQVVLVNSNPATIMTDPDIADVVYIEPITKEAITKIIEKERPDAILPTVGGQTALNVTMELHNMSILDSYNVELIGAKVDAIKKAEDRSLFRSAMLKIGARIPKSVMANNMKEAFDALDQIFFPIILRPAFTLGGTGGAIVDNEDDFKEKVRNALSLSPVSQVLIEESIAGFKEFELELMRDQADNVVIICSIENLDPMGVHTGDSITIAPALTLSDKEYQKMRSLAIKIIREIGVDTGGSNIQFAVNPLDGEIYVIEMNPRVSRSSALASKATGFPIAKIAAKLSVGLRLDEIKNDITGKTLASFEPTIDYVVTKIPRFAFEKFPESDNRLGAQMKSVGEVMAIGRNFRESIQKALRSLEIGSFGFDKVDIAEDQLLEMLSSARPNNIILVGEALRRGIGIEKLYEITKIDRWFLYQIKILIDMEREIDLESIEDRDFLKLLKSNGFSDKKIADLVLKDEEYIKKLRDRHNIKPAYKRIDTCAAEFSATTNYIYSSYDKENEVERTDKSKVMILGGGPNRIGQGIEFDYCCVHALLGLKKDQYETIMVNCNPETVSTDYDISDKLYFEPLTFEDIVSIIELERPDGVIVQFGGQTPLNLAMRLKQADAKIIGTDPESIKVAEDREEFKKIVEKLRLRQPPNATAFTKEAAIDIAGKIGYPVVVRPSFVLGGRAMAVVYEQADLEKYIKEAIDISCGQPILIDKFLNDATEIDVDAISDGKNVVIAGIMEHIEEAGIHSGDSALSLPPRTLSKPILDEIREATKLLALELDTLGVINIQFAVADEKLYLIEVNPRASRTLPFVSKAIGIPVAQYAARVMGGKTLDDLNFTKELSRKHIAIKESVFPFNKFSNADTILGPEMKSTGEVMGIDRSFGGAFYRATLAAGYKLPSEGMIFISIADEDKAEIIDIAKKLSGLGFTIAATRGTAKYLADYKVSVVEVLKVKEGNPNCVDMIEDGTIKMVINTTFGRQSIEDSYSIRRMALLKNIPYQTTIRAAVAAVYAIESKLDALFDVTAITDYYKEIS